MGLIVEGQGGDEGDLYLVRDVEVVDEFLPVEEGAGDRLGTIVSCDYGAILHEHPVDLVLYRLP